jgi:hypothetical protein
MIEESKEPITFLILDKTLKDLIETQQEIERLTSGLNSDLDNVCKTLEIRLLEMIPISEETELIFSILRAEVDIKSNGHPARKGTLLSEIISKGFDRENICFLKNFTLNKIIAMFPIVGVPFQEIELEFRKLENYWKGQMAIVATRDELYYYFNFVRLV